MKVNTQQKVIISIFVLALVGLLCDRAFLLPKQVSAKATEDGDVPDSRLIFALDSLAEVSEEDWGIKQRLNEHLPSDTLDVNQLRDAFTLPSDWLASGRSAHAKSVGEGKDFKKEYPLQAIMFQDEVKAVFMNDKVVRVGDTVDGYELVALSETTAVFSMNGTLIELLLD